MNNDDPKTQRRIFRLMVEYFELDDQEKDTRKRKLVVRDELLSITNPGRYGKGIVYQVKDKDIHVEDYWRRGFKAIRRAGNSKYTHPNKA